MPHDRSTESMVGTEYTERSKRTEDPHDTLRRLRLGRWSEIEHRLLGRLVPRARAGPLRRRPTTPPGLGPSPLVADIGIDLPAGIARVRRDLVDAWAVDPDRIWSTATTNLDRRQPPPTAVVIDGAIRFRIVVGDPWTTGLLLRPERLATIGLDPGGSDGGSGGPVTGPMLAVAPNPEVVLLADRIGPAVDPDPWGDLVEPLLALACDLVGVDGGSRLPVAVLAVTGPGSFPGGWILE